MQLDTHDNIRLAREELLNVLLKYIKEPNNNVLIPDPTPAIQLIANAEAVLLNPQYRPHNPNALPSGTLVLYDKKTGTYQIA